MVGCPGSGKGTLSARIERHFGVPIITAGDLLRSHIRQGTPLGHAASASIRAGRLMPDATMTVSYTHLTLPTNSLCRSRWSPYH